MTTPTRLFAAALLLEELGITDVSVTADRTGSITFIGDDELVHRLAAHIDATRTSEVEVSPRVYAGRLDGCPVRLEGYWVREVAA